MEATRFATYCENMFVTAADQSATLEQLAANALSQGAEFYQKEDYKSAIKAFRRAIGLSPTSDYSSQACDNMATCYLQLEDTERAIKTYEEAIQRFPTDDSFYYKLGNVLYGEERYQEAQKVYEKAVRIDASANNLYALGQAYMQNGRYSDAEEQYLNYIRLEPNSGNGYYGLGQVYNKMGRNQEAVDQFLKAIDLRPDFNEAYADLGYAYADLGEIEKAQEQVTYLEDVDEDLAETLTKYINSVQRPKLEGAFSGLGTFSYTLPAKTPVAALDSYLAQADSSMVFTIALVFSKDMDIASVTNTLNWTITRSEPTGAGKAYNFGLPVSEDEVHLPFRPEWITYDTDTRTATVAFRIEQNSTLTARIDPGHVQFQFTGVDTDGLRMDPDADQFTGFSGVY